MAAGADSASRAVAVVAVGAVLPDAPDAAAFWQNLVDGRYSISDVPPQRWNPDWFWDPDPSVPDKAYSKIGGWVRDFGWDPMAWHLPIPPKVADAMDDAQKWAVATTRAVLEDYGWPDRELATDRTAVIIGNAMAGENHYRTALRVDFPVFAEQLRTSETFAGLSTEVREAVLEEARAGLNSLIPAITEDTMPGELANIIAGRVAAIFDLHGPNFVTDAACASAIAAIDAAIEGLEEREFDAVITGGIDRNMGAATFVKFCKIGALSATGTRPYAEGADGFVMGEGAALFLLKRLEDAERDGDRIYAVIRGVAGSSDGRGKGITAPNPAGQRRAVERAWQRAGLDPATATYIEGHGTSTKVGDVVEFQGLTDVFGAAGAATGSIGLGSVKSNIGHLKGAAGAAGILKTVLAIHHGRIPPSLGFVRPNPDIDLDGSPLRVVDELRDWEPAGGIRRAGVSAFGFGGTNFHAVLESHRPGELTSPGRSVSFADTPATSDTATAGAAGAPAVRAAGAKVPLRGAAVIGGATDAAVAARLRDLAAAAAGGPPMLTAPDPADLAAPVRVAIDHDDGDDLAASATRCADALESGNEAAWRLLANQGAFLGRGPAPKVAFLYTGQGSQYVNMLAGLIDVEPLVAQVFADADRVMTPLLGQPLTELVFTDPSDEARVAELTEHLKRTEITQPAVLATDLALTRLLEAYRVTPDMVMGHSLGEYGALVAAGSLGFDAALEAVSARGREMAELVVEDNGAMAAVMAPLAEVRKVIEAVEGYVVVANVNSFNQSVIGGATAAVEDAVALLTERGMTAVRIPVSHAFHTSIVAPAAAPLRDALHRLRVREPRLPVVANVTGEFYPRGGAGDERMLDILGRQVASPVQFVKGLETLYEAGARVFVEVGPKRALHGFTEDVLGGHDDVVSLFTNHPKQGDVVAFNRAMCGLWAAGLGGGAATTPTTSGAATVAEDRRATGDRETTMDDDTYLQLGHLFAEFLDRGREIFEGRGVASAVAGTGPASVAGEPVVVTGAALGIPGTERMFGDDDLRRILHGDQLIDQIPEHARRDILDKHIVRLVKRESGDPTFEEIDSPEEVIKLAGRGGALDLGEFDIDPERVAALDTTTKLAIGAGIGALRDAGLPLVRHYRETSVGSLLPERWMLPPGLRDDTGVIFASAFPGYDAFATELDRYHEDRSRQARLELLESLRSRVEDGSPAAVEIDHDIHELQADHERDPFLFDRRFLFRVLAMGHSQFAELIGARGPNTQVNAACASTTQAVTIAEDWIRAGRCRRVVVIAADDASSDHLIDWIGSGFLASGAAATDGVVEEAALPFDNRRHGMILGMGAAALVVESPAAAAERGIRPICEVLGGVTANSAFHGTRLDVEHICGVMESTLAQAEARGIDRRAIAPETVFVSHETYTPARGGSASAEIRALRSVFGDVADDIVIANTKGLTGHPMGAGIEDVVAVKSLETGIVPPVPNFREVDPELGDLNISRGGTYPVRFALRLAAGFGSQISMLLLRWTPMPDGAHREPDELGFAYRIEDRTAWAAWLERVAGPGATVEVDHHWLRVVDDGTGDRHAGLARTGTEGTAPTAPVAAPAAAPPAAPPHAPPTAAPAATPAAASGEPASDTDDAGADALVERVLAMVAEATGYPVDMLDPELDMEADLGIDTVKQAEVFGAIRESFGIERDDRLKLRDYPTLGHVVGFVRERAEGLDTAAPAAAAAPEAASAGGAGSAGGADVVVERVLAMVAEATGYPVDMLDPELDMEADLGIDTVKQAEVFGAIRESFGIERDDRLKLRDYPTLGHVVGFVRERAEGLDTAAPAAAAAPEAASAGGAGSAGGADVVVERVLAMVAEATGYPVDMLDPELDMEADLGIDTVKQAEVFGAIRESFGIERDDRLKLRDYPTLGHVVGFVRERAEGLDTAAPAAAAAPEAASAGGAGSAGGADVVVERVLAMVAEATGYPVDMLDPELDMEADLGIDTVKQAEVFGAIRESFGIERDDRLKLRDYPTLGHVVGFVRERAEGLDTAVPAPGAAAGTAPAGDSPGATQVTLAPMEGSLEAADEVPRRVPVPELRPDLGSCVPTGVELGDGDRVLVVGDPEGTGPALRDLLEGRGVEVGLVDPADPAAASAAAEAFRAAGAVTGVYWLPALVGEPAEAATDLEAFRSAAGTRVHLLHRTLRALYGGDEEAGPFLVSATRLGGWHGYGPEPATSPLGGAVTGYTKAYGREQPGTLVKAVDLPAGTSPHDVAQVLVEETLRDPGCVEVGRRDGERFTIGLLARPAADGGPGMELSPDSVFVVTGAAGSIVCAIVADLARVSGGTFHLLDLTPEPDRADADLGRLATDREGLQRDVFERLSASGERATPAKVNAEMARLERSGAALAAIEAVEASGGVAHYHSVDLRDAGAVGAVIDQVAAADGRIDVLVHAAGLEISRSIPDKDPDEFALVFGVKSEGWVNLMSAAADLPIGATVVFSSVAGRFGNTGQVDYSAANDLLCKYSSAMRATRPDTRAIAIDWTAWADIGMATRGSIPTMMKMAGIEMLPAVAGIATVRRELTAGSTSGEVLVAGTLGVLAEERHPTGGLDPGSLDPRSAGPLLERVEAMGVHCGLRVAFTPDPGAQPFLDDHRIDDAAVLPGVMGVEAFAEAARLLLPGHHVLAVEDVDFLAPFKFYRDEPREVTVAARFRPDGDEVLVDCELIGERTLAHSEEPQVTVHFTGMVRMGTSPPVAPPAVAPPPGAATLDPDAIYAVYFHGPAFRVLGGAYGADGATVGLMVQDLPPAFASEGPPASMAPRLIELCFQTAGVSEMAEEFRMGLPTHIDSVTTLGAHGDTPGPLHAVVRRSDDDGGDGFDCSVVDGDGTVVVHMSGYRTVSMPVDAADLAPFREGLS